MAGSGFVSLYSACSVTSGVFFGAGTALAGADPFASGELFRAMLVGARETRAGACCDDLLVCFAPEALDSSFNVGSSDTVIFSGGIERVEGRAQSSIAAMWTARDAAKKPASGR